MSVESKKQTTKWASFAPVAVFSLSMLAAYQGVHYATVALVWDGACCPSPGHAIGGQHVPDWAECFFLPAHIVDSLIGFDPYRRITPHVRTDIAPW
jgi:hypothetical protein